MDLSESTVSRRGMMRSVAASLGFSASGFLSRQAMAFVSGSDRLSYEVDLTSPAKYSENGESWVHARSGMIPATTTGGSPSVLITMNIMQSKGSDVFPGVVSMRTDNLGKTWTKPVLDRNLAPRLETVEDKPLLPVAASDFYPLFHAKSGLLLNIGHTVTYGRGDRDQWLYRTYRERHTVWTVYDIKRSSWHPWQRMILPRSNRGEYFYHTGAGSV